MKIMALEERDPGPELGGEARGGACKRVPQPAASEQEESAGAWSFATDDAQQRVDQVASAEPGGYTSAGLPRRTPRAQLAPGSAPATSSEPASSVPQRSKYSCNCWRSAALS